MISEGMIRRARPEEARLLTDLTIRSKAYWGYDYRFMAQARRQLKISAEQIREHVAFVLEAGGSIQGYYSLEEPDGDNRIDMTLENLFVRPEAIGSGIGTRLLRHAIETARSSGYSRLILHSDPHAAGFYRKMGAEQIGEAPGMTPGRILPIMCFDLQRGD